MKNKHGINNELKKKSSKCISCPNQTFSKKVLLIDHLNVHHGACIKKEIYNFSNVSGMYDDLFREIFLFIIFILIIFYILEFNSWLKEYELKNRCEYVLLTGKKKCKDGHRSYYECGRTGVHKEIDCSKRLKKSQGSKKLNICCTSHIILFEYFNKSSCNIVFYKHHYGHQENEILHISLPNIIKHEIAVKLSQGMTIERILDDSKSNIGSDLKRENLVTRANLHNIKQNYNIIMQDGQLHKSGNTIYNNKKALNMQEFKEKAISLTNKINNLKNNDHLKMSLKELNSIQVFIDTASNNDELPHDFSEQLNEPLNKKLNYKTHSFLQKNEKQENINELIKPSQVETEHFNNVLLQKKSYNLYCNQSEHSYFKK